MANKVVIVDYVNGLLNESGASVPDSTIIAGMEDIVRKLEQTNPAALKPLETERVVDAFPYTLRYVAPTLEVFANGKKAIRRDNAEHISNPYSMLNDGNETTYFYVVGNKLHVVPKTDAKYVVRTIEFSVQNNNIVWYDRYNYPLALYCAYATLFGHVSKEIGAIITESGSSLGLNVDTMLNLQYTRPLSRLASDDVELAHAELDRIKTRIAEYQAMTGADSVAGSKMQNRVAIQEQRLATANMLRGQYLEWFGIGGQE